MFKNVFGFTMAAALSLSPALAMPADQLDINNYGRSDNWQLRVASADGQPQICDAITLTGGEQGLYFEYNYSNSAIGFSGLGSAADPGAVDVEVWFDRNRAESEIVSMSLETDVAGYEWRMARMTNDEPWGMLDSFANASTIHFVYMVPGEGEHQESFPLRGSNKAFKQTIACMGDLSQSTATANTQDVPATTDMASTQDVSSVDPSVQGHLRQLPADR